MFPAIQNKIGTSNLKIHGTKLNRLIKFIHIYELEQNSSKPAAGIL